MINYDNDDKDDDDDDDDALGREGGQRGLGAAPRVA